MYARANSERWGRCSLDHPLQVMPIGGLGEIGMNCMLVGCRDRWVMVDCGVQFPDPLELGAERKLPDLGFIASMRDRIEAIVITHGHEDHIGALPWVLPILGDIPVFAGAFTTELIRERVSEHGLWNSGLVTLHEPNTPFQAGPFEVEPIRVTHSLPECSSLVLRSEDGTILHTGDWKIDEQPMDGEDFDREAFERVGKEGVTLLLSDSTNIMTPGRTLGERVVADNLIKLIQGTDDRVVVALFASNLHRVRGLVEAAETSGRQLMFAGRSLWKYLRAASRVGRAPIDPGRVLDIDKITQIAPEKSLILATGTQGETMATLRRAATGKHPHLTLGRGDLVVHSARVIPGNETSAYETFNQISRRGADLMYGGRTGLHASGHARQDELEELIRLLNPAHMVPIHGEHTFLRRHAALADKVLPAGCTVLSNGEIFGFGAGANHGQIRSEARIAQHHLNIYYNDGPATGDYDDMRIRERLRVAWNGLVMLSVRWDDAKEDARTVSEVRLEVRALWSDDGKLVQEVEKVAKDAIESADPKLSLTELEELTAQRVRAHCRKRTGKRPEVIVFLPRTGGQ
jgi:beta-CASP RNase J family ribonuclease